MASIMKTLVLGLASRGLKGKSVHFLICLVLFVLAGSQFGCAPARLENVIIQERPAKPSEYQLIQIIRKGEPIAAKESMQLKAGDEIRTDSESTAVISFLEGMSVVAEIVVKPNTHVKIFNPELKILVIIGEIYTRIMKSKGTFAVQTEYVEVMPHGTEFYVSVDKGQDLTVVVIDGSIRLKSRAELWHPITLSRFQQGSVSGDGKPEVSIADRDQINTIIRGVNTIERLMKRDESRLLVPDLTGLSEDEAMRILANSRLIAGDKKRIITGKSPVGTVVGQKPEAGTRVSPQSRIEIDVEAEPVRVPDLKGSSRAKAEQVLRQSGLSVGRIQLEITGRYPKYTILRQEPRGGEIVPKFSTVNLWIEAESVLVPDIRRLHISDARQRLERARLRPGRVNERMTGGAEPNTILDQHPSPGTRLRPGSEVVMTMEVESAIVPSVERRHVNDAMRLIQAARLNFRKVREDITGTVPHGTVLHQTPSPGTRVRLHTMVDVVIEAESVIVPNVMGKNVNEAMQFVQRAKLRPYTQMEYSGRATRNNVLRQNPGAGTRVRPGTAVTLSVEGAYLMMPNFIGLQIGQAQRLLMERGIGQVRTEQRETRSYSAGTVMDQYPRAGTPVRSLGEIRLVVAKEQLCVVPYVVGQTVTNALNILRNAGLVPHLNCQGGDAGGCDYIRHRLTVRDQHPQGGTRLRCGSRVTLTYQGAVG